MLFGAKSPNSLLISLLAGNENAETGSMATASAASQVEIIWKFSIISTLPILQNPLSLRRFPPPWSLDELEWVLCRAIACSGARWRRIGGDGSAQTAHTVAGLVLRIGQGPAIF
jgi:hypothetical protein